MQRSSGILMPVFSLPSPYGIGTFGKAAYDFVDFLELAGQSWWQMLPLGPTSYGDSPYQSFSSFAGNPYFIDLDLLIRDGLLEQEDVDLDWGGTKDRVDYGRVYELRFGVLEKAFRRGWERDRDKVQAFVWENIRWLPDYALFMACKRHFGMRAWTEWDEDIRLRRPEAVREYTRKLKHDVDLFTYLQYLFFKQWNDLRAYARSKGIGIIGDVPIYVAMDSADVWAEPQFFALDADNLPVEVAGVPPDAFSDDGQLWGNPLYDWDAMKRDGYGWWIRRVDGASKLFDVIRIDHFRGFAAYWAVPAGEKTAVNGRWCPGPGVDLVGVLTSWFHGLQYIAEDLGVITDDVIKLLEDSGLPGMRVLEFAFGSDSKNGHLPHNYTRNTVCYVATHDNDTVMAWKDSFPAKDIANAKKYFGLTEEEGINWGMIRGGMSSVADLFVAQMQDYLGYGNEARTNEPSTASGNWSWRMRSRTATKKLAKKIRSMTEFFGRLPLEEKKKA